MVCGRRTETNQDSLNSGFRRNDGFISLQLEWRHNLSLRSYAVTSPLVPRLSLTPCR